MAGVELFVFVTSAPVPDAAPGVAAVDLKVEAERLVRGSGVASIVVRPTIYMGNLAAPWSAPAIANDAVVAYPLPEDVAVAWIAWEDAAAAVATALARPDLAGRKFDVGGQRRLTARASPQPSRGRSGARTAMRRSPCRASRPA